MLLTKIGQKKNLEIPTITSKFFASIPSSPVKIMSEIRINGILYQQDQANKKILSNHDQIRYNHQLFATSPLNTPASDQTRSKYLEKS